MCDISNEFIYEVLKQLQAGLAEVKAVQGSHTRQFLRVRDDINNVRDDINGLRGDDLRVETMLANLDSRLECVEHRLNLSDA